MTNEGNFLKEVPLTAFVKMFSLSPSLWTFTLCDGQVYFFTACFYGRSHCAYGTRSWFAWMPFLCLVAKKWRKKRRQGTQCPLNPCSAPRQNKFCLIVAQKTYLFNARKPKLNKLGLTFGQKALHFSPFPRFSNIVEKKGWTGCWQNKKIGGTENVQSL